MVSKKPTLFNIQQIMASPSFTKEQVDAMIQDEMKKKEIEMMKKIEIKMMEKDKQLKEAKEKLAESERAREQEKQQKKSERSEKVLETVQQEMNDIISSANNFREKMTKEILRKQYKKLRTTRTEQWLHAKKLLKRFNAGETHVINDAEEKSGKKDITIALQYEIWNDCLRKSNKCINGRNVFSEIEFREYIKKSPFVINFVALNRVDTHPQHEEYIKLGIPSKIVDTKEKAQRCLEVIDSLIPNNSILALDECDYGSGKKMSIGEFAEYPKYKKLYISATVHEIKVALEGQDIYNPENHLIFEPSYQYRGAKWYLENGLVKEPNPFFS